MSKSPASAILSAMSLQEAEAAIAEDLLIMPDVFERMSYLTDTAPLTSPPEGEQLEGFVVAGCMAELHVVPEQEDGIWNFRPYSNAPMVAAIAHLLCRVYSGQPADQILGHECNILETVGIHRQLSPNRQAGAANIVAKIQGYVRS